MPRPLPKIEDFLYLFKGKDYIISDEVFKINSLIKFTCDLNHSYVYSVANLKNGKDVNDCPHCLKPNKLEKNREIKGISREQLLQIAERNNYTLESPNEYFNRNDQKVYFRCIKCKELKEFGTPKYILTLDKIICKNCDLNLKKIDIDINSIEIKEATPPVIILENSVYTKPLVGKIIEKINNSLWHVVEYNGIHAKGIFQCKLCGTKKTCYPGIGGLFSKHDNENNHGCKHCYLKANKLQVESKIKKICSENNLVTFFEKYKDIETKMTFGCKECGERFQYSWREINRRYSKINCPFCTKSNKRGEQTEVYDFINSIYNKEIIYEDHKTIKPLQIDIYLPELKIAIEYCGTIWHSTKYNQDINYHKYKLEKCQEKGIRLITIFSDEWKNKKDIVKSRLSNCLGLSKKIFARKCEVTSISNKVALDFCDQYHIQGKGQTNQSYGLFYEDKLLSVMTFSKPMICKSANGYDYELNRFCTVPEYVITGGASRLFKAFLNDNKNIHVISFCDLRWGTGKVYKQLGMEQVTSTRPNYYYVGQVTNWERKHRFNYTKKRLLELYPTNIPSTEFEIAETNGLFRIYDCGHLKFSYKN